MSRRSGNAIDEVGVRQRSANLITRTDVDAVDHWLIEQVRLNRADQHIIIDSHPVIKEDYGFRVTAFSPEQLRDLNQDAIVCLYVAPNVTRKRITADAAGRPLPTDFELGLHAHLQASLTAQYAFILGKPCYLLDSSIALDELAKNVGRIARLA